MPDSVLVETAIAMSDDIETQRQAAAFTENTFTTSWDFESRDTDLELADANLHVSVIVPQMYRLERFTRGELVYYAGFFIDVRQKIAVANQDGEYLPDKTRLRTLSKLTEELIERFWTVDHLTTAAGYDAQFFAGDDDGEKGSEIIVSYSENELRDMRQWSSVARVLMQITKEL